MYRIVKLLLLLSLAIIVSIVYVGCEQPEDVLTAISSTDIFLNEELMPSNPSGTIYELWVANSSDSVSLGKFGYDFETRVYYDGQMNIKSDSNFFSIDYDLSQFDVIFVAVEMIPDSKPNSPGSIMLIDFLASPTIKLRFPNIDSLWEGTIRYSMETPSNGIDTAFDGYGIWFATYEEVTTAFSDTSLVDGLLDWSLDSSDFVDSNNCIESNVIYGLESIIQKDTSIIFGLDTLIHSVVRFNVVESTQTCGYYPTQLTINYNVTPGTVTFDRYSQDEFGLPDVSQFGWKYKGWVVSPEIDENLTGTITLPSWIIFGDEFDESAGGMLTTGTFSDVTTADDGNPYTASDRVPDYPGEDFLVNLPGGMDAVNLIPNDSGNAGMVFLSLEPIDFISSSNFPLIAFVDKQLPQMRAFVTTSSDANGNTYFQMFTLRGWMHSNDPYRGFPRVTVELITY